MIRARHIGLLLLPALAALLWAAVSPAAPGATRGTTNAAAARAHEAKPAPQPALEAPAASHERPQRVAAPQPTQTAPARDRKPTHPITDEHRALYRDADLLHAAWQALREEDFDTARDVLAEHRREFESGPGDMNQGLSILADCMQERSPQSRQRAQAFYDTQTHSMVRRRLRRHCLEVVPPGGG